MCDKVLNVHYCFEAISWILFIVLGLVFGYINYNKMKVQRTLMKQVTAILEEKLNFYSQFNPSPLSVKKFTDFGKLQSDRSGKFLMLNVSERCKSYI